ncbi:hypothetical protein [Bacillus sp. 1P06AnD]|uniref:hypothetical protein n=1 Tax=Bacillus sp. 1P06AnD TaxID=3132208 RepID=UPI0039A0B512
MNKKKKVIMTAEKREQLDQLRLNIQLKTTPFLQSAYLADNLPQVLWDKIRQAILEDQICCHICSSSKGKSYLFTDWDFDYTNQTVSIKSIKPLCYSCFCLQDYETSLGFLDEQERTALIQHFLQVNKCKKDIYQLHLRDLKIKQHANYTTVFKEAEQISLGNIEQLPMFINTLMDTQAQHKQSVAEKAVIKVDHQVPFHREIEEALNEIRINKQQCLLSSL